MKNRRFLPILMLLFVSGWTEAQIHIDQLVEQARMVEGGIAVREMPRWQTTHKILLRDVGTDMSEFAAAYPDVEFITVDSMAAAMQHASDVDAIVGYCESELINAAQHLLWVQIYTAGAERCLSVDGIGDGDIVLTNMQKMSSPVIAEHAITLLLSLQRQLPYFVRAMQDNNWSRRPVENMTSVAGKTLLVAGLGGIGLEVARLGAALGMRVIGTRNSSREGPDYVEYVGLSDELFALAEEADVVVNALPLTTSTRNLFDSNFFAAVKPGAVFVNVGRGGTVVTADLIAALESGRLSAAGLDVTEPEPLPADSPLWQFDNVLITPHVAGRGGEWERHAVLIRENLRRYIAGERLLNVVDPVKGY